MDQNRGKPSPVTTEQLLEWVRDARSLERFYEKAGDNLPNVTTSAYLAELLAARGLSRREVIETANLERSSGYLIFAGQRNAKRDTLLRIALAMKLSLAETQRLLKIAQRGELYPKNHRDAALIYCIHHQLNLIESEMLLDGIGEPLLT